MTETTRTETTGHQSVPRLQDLPDLDGKTVLVRVDFNVPFQDGEIADDLRIRAALPTLQYLQQAGAKVKACSHLGRPKGQVVETLRMAPIQARLDELITGVELLENLRFNPGEKNNDPAFVQELIDGVDIYVNDAFGACHRAHASIVGPPKFLPSAAGKLLEKEVSVLAPLPDTARKPFIAVMGGSKISDKLGIVETLLPKVDKLLVGGAMCFTFFKAKGVSIGSSLVEDEMVETCAELLETSGDKIVLPHDLVALSPDGALFSDRGTVRQSGVNLPEGWGGADIGAGTAAEFCDHIEDSQTVFWNGTMGANEDPRFAAGTEAVAKTMASARAFTVVGGGDSAAAVHHLNLAAEMSHVSTGGGAALELLEKGDLVGLEALRAASA